MRKRLRDESGIALVMAVGILSVLMITGSAVVFYAGSNTRSAEYSADNQKALNFAEAGLNYARSTVWNAADPTSPTSFSGGPLTLEGATVTYAGSFDTTTKVWTLTGTATFANPTGGAPLSRTASSQVLVAATSGLDPVWGYLFADTTSCTTLSNSFAVDAPIYVRGDLCLENNGVIISELVQVRGTVQIKNSASIGTASVAVPRVMVGGGCRYPWSGSYVTPCSSSQRVYSSIFESTVPDLTKPPLELAKYYDEAKPGPMSQNCTTGSFPGTFDTDTVLNGLNPSVNLFPTTSYDCTVQASPGGPVLGRIAYTPGNPGTFIVEGVVFFDGPIELAGNRDVVYQSRGTIYANGKITIRNFVRLCGVEACDTTWNPEQHLITFVSGTDEAVGFEIENNTTFQGAIYVNTDFVQDNSVALCGPVVAQELLISNNTSNCYVPFSTGTPGMPGTSAPTVTLLNVPNSFTTD